VYKTACLCFAFHPLLSLLLQLFQHAGSPLALLLEQQHQQQDAAAHTNSNSSSSSTGVQPATALELLAMACLRTLQLVPEVIRSWGASLLVPLLRHPVPLVRWCCLEALGALLHLQGPDWSRLMDQQVAEEDMVMLMAK
jgi:hypothetical protein